MCSSHQSTHDNRGTQCHADGRIRIALRPRRRRDRGASRRAGSTARGRCLPATRTPTGPVPRLSGRVSSSSPWRSPPLRRLHGTAGVSRPQRGGVTSGCGPLCWTLASDVDGGQNTAVRRGGSRAGRPRAVGVRQRRGRWAACRMLRFRPRARAATAGGRDSRAG